MKRVDSKPFPCPFCQSSRVELIGGGLVFLHYQCSECSEVWTAMATTARLRRPARRRDDDHYAPATTPGNPKIWLN